MSTAETNHIVVTNFDIFFTSLTQESTPSFIPDHTILNRDGLSNSGYNSPFKPATESNTIPMPQ